MKKKVREKKVIVIIVIIFLYTDLHLYKRMRNLTITLLFKYRVIYKLYTKTSLFLCVHL